MYQALYRKYRPKTLDDIYGQDIIVKILKNSIKKNQINHAYLFAGPRGTGKTSIAKIFAKIVNCENPKNYISCGKCKSCIEINNTDIIEIDAASNNGIDEIRELKNKVNLVPSYGKYKVYIIDEVHMLTVGAFNALLKTLEEPPGHVIFILATTDPEKIPETILSRCQRFDFKKITNDDIVKNLTKIVENEKIKITTEALNEVAVLSDGGMRDSVGMLDQLRTYSDDEISIVDVHDINGTLTEKEIKTLITYVFDNNVEKIIEEIDYYNEKGKNFNKLIEEIIFFLRNVLLYDNAPNYFKTKYKNTNIYSDIVEKINTEQILEYIKVLNNTATEMKKTNNSKLLFELAFIELIPNNSVKSTQTPIIQEKTTEKEEKLEKPEKKVLKIEKEEKKDNKKLENLKEIRINNTLSKFSKKTLTEIKKQITNLDDFLLNPDYSKYASILLDGSLRAASDEYLIFVYDNSRMSLNFNKNLIEIEETIKQILNKKYKVISTDLNDWNVIKESFNKKTKKYVYNKEKYKLKEILNQEKDEISKDFEDIIEYN